MSFRGRLLPFLRISRKPRAEMSLAGPTPSIKPYGTIDGIPMEKRGYTFRSLNLKHRYVVRSINQSPGSVEMICSPQ